MINNKLCRTMREGRSGRNDKWSPIAWQSPRTRTHLIDLFSFWQTPKSSYIAASFFLSWLLFHCAILRSLFSQRKQFCISDFPHHVTALHRQSILVNYVDKIKQYDLIQCRRAANAIWPNSADFSAMQAIHAKIMRCKQREWRRDMYHILRNERDKIIRDWLRDKWNSCRTGWEERRNWSAFFSFLYLVV